MHHLVQNMICECSGSTRIETLSNVHVTSGVFLMPAAIDGISKTRGKMLQGKMVCSDVQSVCNRQLKTRKCTAEDAGSEPLDVILVPGVAFDRGCGRVRALPRGS